MTRWIAIGAGILLLAASVACASASPAPATPSRPPGATNATGSNVSPSPRQSAGTPPAASKATPAPVAASVVTADGRISYVNDRGLTFGTGGQIARISVKELDRVSKGQVLARLDTTILDQAVKAAEFGVTAAEFAYKSATADRKLAEAAVVSAQADLKTMQANFKSVGIDLDTATNSLVRISYPYTYATFSIDIPAAISSIASAQLALNVAAANLQPGTTNYGDAASRLNSAQTSLNTALQQLAKGVNLDSIVSSVSQSKAGVASTGQAWATTDIWTIKAAQLAVDKARVAVDNAQNAVDKAGVSIENTRNALGKAQIAEDKAKSDVDRARNDLDKAKFALTQAVITAPFEGTVAAVNSKELDLISAGGYASAVVVEIVDPRQMELVVKIGELDIPKVKVGQKAIIRVDALPDQPVSAVVASVASLPSVDNGVVSYLVKISFDVPQGSALKAGMAATADITNQ